MMNRRFVVAITGASGAVYAVRLLEVLLRAECEIHLSISPAATHVLRQELDLEVDLDAFRLDDLLVEAAQQVPGGKLARLRGASSSGGGSFLTLEGDFAAQVHYHRFDNLMAPIASGSFLTDGMVVCPCSGGTVSAIAHGTSTNLIHRAADVHLKERRPLILVPRETPLSVVQLGNLTRAAEVGAVVLPAMPGWYHGACSLADLVDFIVARICDQAGVDHALVDRWGEPPR